MEYVGLHAAWVIVGAVLVDVLFGEVPNRVHPVVGMGWLTRRLLAWRPGREPAAEFIFGAFLVLVVALASGATAWSFERVLYATSSWLGQWVPSTFALSVARLIAGAAEIIALSTLFAARGLLDAGRRMRRALETSVDGSLEQGRAALSHLCSRNASDLGREELCGATVESLAENASDSFVAPLFWYVCATLLGGSGLVAAAIYRAANTLDAMIGYRGQYEYVGKCAARLDDALNWIPARVTALTLLLASALCGLRVRQAWYVAWREHMATESPNAGWPMALAAGALGVELSKRESYVLGRGLGAPESATIADCERLIAVCFAVFTLAAGGVLIGAAYV